MIRYRTAVARHLAAERRADAERAAGIPDRTDDDARTVCIVDLRGAGGPSLVIEPRRGYHAWRARDSGTGAVIGCAAIKTLLHQIADRMPRTLGPRHH